MVRFSRAPARLNPPLVRIVRFDKYTSGVYGSNIIAGLLSSQGNMLEALYCVKHKILSFGAAVPPFALWRWEHPFWGVILDMGELTT